MKKLDVSQASSFLNIHAEEEPGDYRDASGLLICGTCGERKESRQNVLGIEKRLPIDCACKRHLREREKAAEEQKKRDHEAEKLRNACFPFKSMHSMTFANADGSNSDDLAKCRKYADNFERFKEVGGGLIFYGYVGSGKTYAAACIANALIDELRPVLFTSLAALGSKMNATRFDKTDVLSDICRYDCVVLDDLGIERDTPAMAEHVYQIVNSLYLSGTVMICTTNLDMASIQGETDPGRARIYSRILECCRPFEMKGGDRRKNKSREKSKLYAEVWGER